MPSMIDDSYPLPVSSSTFPISSFAPGATPFSCPPLAFPVPATVAATCVPCPNRSTVSPLPLKSRACATFPARSG
jgi:hypothetical protein